MKKPNIQMAPHSIHSATVKSAIDGRLSHIKMSAALQQRIRNEIDRIEQEKLAPKPQPAAATKKMKKGHEPSHIAVEIQHIKASTPPVVAPNVAQQLPMSGRPAQPPHSNQNILYINDMPPMAAPAPIYWTPPSNPQMPAAIDNTPPKRRFRAKRAFVMLIAAILVLCLSFSALGATVPAINNAINNVSPEVAEFLGRENLVAGQIDEIPPPVPFDDTVISIDGIELRVTDVQQDGVNLIIFYTLRDTTGNRINQDSDFQLLSINGHLLEDGHYLRHYDQETGILTVAAIFEGCLIQDETLGLMLKVKRPTGDLSNEETEENPSPPPEEETGEDLPLASDEQYEYVSLASDDEKLNLAFHQITTLFEYAAIPIEIDWASLPPSPSTMWLGSGEGFWPAETVDGADAALAQEALDTTGLEVLTPGDLALPIAGLDFAEISNIGFVGQQLHIQVHFFDDDDSLACGWESLLFGQLPEAGELDLATLNQFLLYRVTFSEHPARGEGSYFEYVYDVSPHGTYNQGIFAVGLWEVKSASESIWMVRGSLAGHPSVGYENHYKFEDFVINKMTFTPYVIQLESSDRALYKSIDSVTIILDDGTEIAFFGDEESPLTIYRKALPDGRYLITIPIIDLPGQRETFQLGQIVAIRMNDTVIDPNADAFDPSDPVDPVEPDPDEPVENPPVEPESVPPSIYTLPKTLNYIKKASPRLDR